MTHLKQLSDNDREHIEKMAESIYCALKNDDDGVDPVHIFETKQAKALSQFADLLEKSPDAMKAWVKIHDACRSVAWLGSGLVSLLKWGLIAAGTVYAYWQFIAPYLGGSGK